MRTRSAKNVVFFVLTCLILVQLLNGSCRAASRAELSIEIPATLEVFKKEVKGGARFLARSAGYLVFPNVYKAGFFFGGEYGEGALLMGGRVVDYYNTVAGSFGLQLGVQRKSIVVVFLSRKALSDFRRSCGWKVGVDGSVALIKWGVGEDINNIDIQDPVVGFIFNNQGLMYDLSLEGAKFTRIQK